MTGTYDLKLRILHPRRSFHLVCQASSTGLLTPEKHDWWASEIRAGRAPRWTNGRVRRLMLVHPWMDWPEVLAGVYPNHGLCRAAARAIGWGLVDAGYEPLSLRQLWGMPRR